MRLIAEEQVARLHMEMVCLKCATDVERKTAACTLQCWWRRIRPQICLSSSDEEESADSNAWLIQARKDALLQVELSELAQNKLDELTPRSRFVSSIRKVNARARWRKAGMYIITANMVVGCLKSQDWKAVEEAESVQAANEQRRRRLRRRTMARLSPCPS